MKIKLLLATFFVVLISSTVTGQTRVRYTYDQNGNRSKRTLIVQSLKSGDTESLSESEKPGETNIEEIQGIKIYPNPFRSSIRLVIDGYDDIEDKTAIIYNLSGSVLLMKEKLGQENIIDLVNYRDGTYVLKLIIGSETFMYKIIKSN